jgi:hypothetical protein
MVSYGVGIGLPTHSAFPDQERSVFVWAEYGFL